MSIMNRLLIAIAIPVIMAAIVWIAFGWVYSSFDVNRYDENGKATAEIFWVLLTTVCNIIALLPDKCFDNGK